MRSQKFLFLFLAMAAPAAAQQQSLGIFGSWGAFSDATRCYAISEPFAASSRSQGSPAYVAVGHWPRDRIKSQIHVRLSEEKRRGSSVLLRIDGRSFQLRGGGRDAWAPNGRADDEILEAMRTGIEMAVVTRNRRGLLVRDHYQLRGAATAMDAAALACLRPR